MQFPPSELVLNSQNQVYHLGIKPENISDKIILVGDQDRVQLIAKLFDSKEHASQHREFACVTGTFEGKRITVLSTGIGTDNIDIVMNELDALVNIDLKTRSLKEDRSVLNLVRIGTCGILQADVPIHDYILSSHAFGLDNVAHFYSIPFTIKEDLLRERLIRHLELPKEIVPYLAEASANLINQLKSDKTHLGITVTSSGFYGPQGRLLRLSLRTKKLNEKLETFRSDDLRVMNFEMESSALFALGKALGHQCATICLGIANRPAGTFSSGYEQEMTDLARYVLKRI